LKGGGFDIGWDQLAVVWTKNIYKL